VQAKQETSPESLNKTPGAATRPTLFKPGQQTFAKGSHSAAASVDSVDYQASVNAFAQQMREQRLKLKQAAVKAEVELDRLKGLLQREQALQVLCVFMHGNRMSRHQISTRAENLLARIMTNLREMSSPVGIMHIYLVNLLHPKQAFISCLCI